MTANMMRRIRAAFVERSKARRSRRKRSESEQLENEFAQLMARSDARGLGVLLAEHAEHQSFPKRGMRARRVLRVTRPSSEDPVQWGDISAVAARKQFGVLRRRDEQRLLVLQRSGLRQDLQHGLLERGWDGTLLPIQRRHFKQIAQSILGLDVGDFRYLESTTSESRAPAHPFQRTSRLALRDDPVKNACFCEHRVLGRSGTRRRGPQVKWSAPRPS